MNRTLTLLFIICFSFVSFKNVVPVFHGEDPATGLFLDGKSKQLYGLFSKNVKSEKDRPFFEVSGEVLDDDNVYTVCASAKINDPYQKGNLLTISNIDKKVTAVGSFNICPEIKKVGFKVAGTASYSTAEPTSKGSVMNPSDMTIDWVAGFDFNLPKNLMKVLMADFINAPIDAQPIKYHESKAYEAALTEWNSKGKKRAGALTELQEGQPFTLPSEDMSNSFTLGSLSMKWNSKLQSFVSTGDQAVLVNMGEEGMHYPIRTKAEFCMPSSQNDQLRLLIDSPNGHYYFFNYMNGVLQTCSSNAAYNQYLIDLSDKESEIAVYKGQPYELHFASAYVVDLFQNRVGE